MYLIQPRNQVKENPFKRQENYVTLEGVHGSQKDMFEDSEDDLSCENSSENILKYKENASNRNTLQGIIPHLKLSPCKESCQKRCINFIDEGQRHKINKDFRAGHTFN